MSFQKGDLILVPQDQYSPEELVIITKILPEMGDYEIYDTATGEYDFYIKEYLDEAGQKIG
jgi:hypothetical protein